MGKKLPSGLFGGIFFFFFFFFLFFSFFFSFFLVVIIHITFQTLFSFNPPPHSPLTLYSPSFPPPPPLPPLLTGTSFKQQKLRACTPILTPIPVIVTFFITGAIFIPVGVVLLLQSQDVCCCCCFFFFFFFFFFGGGGGGRGRGKEEGGLL